MASSGIKLSTNFSIKMNIPNFERDSVDVEDINGGQVDKDFYDVGHVVHNLKDKKKYIFDGQKFVQYMKVDNGDIILDCGTF